MSAPTTTRRRFLVGCSAAIAALSGATLGPMAFADPAAAQSEGSDVLIMIFLRGAWDALSVVSPIDGPDRAYYEAARPYLKIPTKGQNAALRLDDRFGLHPAMAPLVDLYHQGQLAFVHGVGMNDNTRSHFDAMQYIEAGTPGRRGTASGWITRYLQQSAAPTLLIPALATGGGVPQSLQGATSAIAMTTPQGFALPGDEAMGRSLQGLYEGDTWLHAAGRQTVGSVTTIHRLGSRRYVPAKGVTYPDGDVGTALQTIAQLLKANLTMRVATIDIGGWDTHEYQGDGGTGYLAELLSSVAHGLAAFYADLAAANLARRVTVAAISEFGRRLTQNASGGTDHGHGSVMLLLGGESIAGGKVYGRWPGLHNDQLYDRADLAVTTDYRQVLSELLLNRMEGRRLDLVFPGFTAGESLGVTQPRR